MATPARPHGAPASTSTASGILWGRRNPAPLEIRRELLRAGIRIILQIIKRHNFEPKALRLPSSPFHYTTEETKQKKGANEKESPFRGYHLHPAAKRGARMQAKHVLVCGGFDHARHRHGDRAVAISGHACCMGGGAR